MEMALIRRRLGKQLGIPVDQFSYHTVTEGIAENTRRLQRYIDRYPKNRIHIVGHSLGGMLALKMLKRFPTPKVDRIVCLGSPLIGSAAACQLSQRPWLRPVLGKTLHESVVAEPLRESAFEHEVGMIAGSVPLGLGRLVARIDAPHDGVVSVAETEWSGLSDHLTLRVSHFGMLLSPRVAWQTGQFILHGRFAARV